MSYGRMKLREPGVPTVSRWQVDRDGQRLYLWFAEFPDPYGHWECCKRTEMVSSRSWREVIDYAVNRRWEQS